MEDAPATTPADEAAAAAAQADKPGPADAPPTATTAAPPGDEARDAPAAAAPSPAAPSPSPTTTPPPPHPPAASPRKKQHWTPLEANPAVFTAFARRLGLPPTSARFVDVYGLDEELLGFVPQPVYALLLLFPITPQTEALRKQGACVF